jgi:tellurite resistance protein
MDLAPLIFLVMAVVVGACFLIAKACDWLDAREKERNKRLDDQMAAILNGNPEAARCYVILKLHVEAAMRQVGSKQCSLTFNV